MRITINFLFFTLGNQINYHRCDLFVMPPFDLQPTLQNDLLLLRPLQSDDLEALYAVASDPLIWEQHPVKNRCERPGFEAFFAEALDSKGAFLVIDKKSGAAIGSTRFQPVKGIPNAVEIGWTFLARPYWGGVYNRQMKQLMLDYAFQFVDCVLLYINEHNLRSQRAAEKIGGRRMEVLDGKVLETKPLSTVIYGIGKAENR